MTSAKEITRKFCGHDLQHFIDTARIAYILILEEKLGENPWAGNVNFEKEIVYGAALLHDVGRWKEYETGEDHAEASAWLAKPILEGAGYSPDEIEIICRAILEHRSLPQHPSLLGYILYKADKLSRSCFNCGAQSECYKWDEKQKRSFLTY